MKARHTRVPEGNTDKSDSGGVADLSLVLPPPPEIPPGYLDGTKASSAASQSREFSPTSGHSPAFPPEEVAIGFLRSLAYKPQELGTICALLKIGNEAGSTLAKVLAQMELVGTTQRTASRTTVFFLTGHGREHLQAVCRSLSKDNLKRDALSYSRVQGDTNISDSASLSQRILIHLFAQPRVDSNQVAPPEITQAGMAKALQKPQPAFAKALSRLESAGLLAAESRYIAGGSRRLKAYQLTPLGESVAQDLRRRGMKA